MGAQGTTLREPFLANLTFIRPFACVSSSMLDQVLSRAKSLPAKLTNLRLLTGVYSYMRLHVLSPYQFSTNLAGDLTLASVGPKMFLVAITVEGFETANVALVLFPGTRLTVNLHMTPQVYAIAEGLVTNLAGARFVVRVHAHVRLQGCLQVETLVADLTEFRKFLVVTSNVNF